MKYGEGKRFLARTELFMQRRAFPLSSPFFRAIIAAITSRQSGSPLCSPCKGKKRWWDRIIARLQKLKRNKYVEKLDLSYLSLSLPSDVTTGCVTKWRFVGWATVGW